MQEDLVSLIHQIRNVLVKKKRAFRISQSSADIANWILYNMKTNQYTFKSMESPGILDLSIKVIVWDKDVLDELRKNIYGIFCPEHHDDLDRYYCIEIKPHKILYSDRGYDKKLCKQYWNATLYFKVIKHH